MLKWEMILVTNKKKCFFCRSFSACLALHRGLNSLSFDFLFFFFQTLLLTISQFSIEMYPLHCNLKARTSHNWKKNVLNKSCNSVCLVRYQIKKKKKKSCLFGSYLTAKKINYFNILALPAAYSPFSARLPLAVVHTLSTMYINSGSSMGKWSSLKEYKVIKAKK